MKNRLRVLRAEKGWSQAELAARLNIARQSVNAIENPIPRFPLAFVLGGCLGFRLGGFLGPFLMFCFNSPDALVKAREFGWPSCPQLPLIDYGSGNLASAAKALARAANGKSEIITTADPQAVLDAERVVLPGVGAFADCMRGLSAVPGMVEACAKKC